MGRMASWKDGAAYAPVERPDGFATPSAEPLPIADPYRAETPGAVAAPAQLTSPPARPLEQLGAAPASQRDPRQGFDVSSMALTTVGGGQERRDPRTPFAVTTSTVTTPGPPPPTGQPLAGPDAPPPPPSARVAGGVQFPPPTGRPAPGPGRVPTQGAWAPPSPLPHQQTPARPDPQALRSQRTLARLAAGLGIAGFILSASAPILLLIAGALGLRTRLLTGVTGPIVLGGAGAMLTVALLTGTLGESSWLNATAALAAGFAFAIGSMRYS